MKELIDWQMELARPYRLWVLYGRWFCVDEVVINRKVFKDGVVAYTIETTDYREVARIGDRYERVLNVIEKYHDDDAEHCYEEVARFNTLNEAIEYVDRFYPPIDLEQEINRYYTFDEDDDEI